MKLSQKLMCILAAVACSISTNEYSPTKYIVSGFSDIDLDIPYFSMNVAHITVSGSRVIIEGLCNKIFVSTNRMEINNTPTITISDNECSKEVEAVEKAIVRAAIHFVSVGIFERKNLDDYLDLGELKDGETTVFLIPDIQD